MQRKMTGNPIGGAAGAALGRDHRGRMMMQPPPPSGAGPYAANQMAPPPPPPPSYLGMNVNLGLTMTMSDMESSIRAYHPSQQQQQHPQQQHHAASPSSNDGNPVPFWRPQQPMDASAYAKHGGLELELGDILGSSNSSNSNMDESERDGNPEGASSDVTMAVMGSSFEVSPFGDHVNIGGGAVGPMKPGYHLSSQPHHLLLRQQQQQQQHVSGGRGGGDQELGRPSTTRSVSSGSGAGASSSTTTESSEYSRFVDSREEPDLSQQKIDEKNEKCQFHNCPNRARVSQAYGKFCNRHVIVAPCGFPGCRDKALLNSSMCDKHLAQGKEALHQILASRAQNVPVCRTFGCFKNDQGRGYCRGHEKLLMATGRLPKHINKRRLNSAYTMCSYPGCNKHSQRNHLCRTHGNLITKQAEELFSRSQGETYEEILSRLQKDVRKCTHPSCTKNSQRDRLCTMHYYEKHNLQRDGASSSSAEQISDSPETIMCSIPDCNLQAFAKGMCKYHSGQGLKSPGSMSDSSASGIRDAERTRCTVPGCVQLAYTSGICMQHFKQTQQPMHGGGGGRYNNVISAFGDGRFSPPMDPTNPRSNMESFYGGGGSSSAANAYASALDATMNSYAALSTGGRHLSAGAAAGGSPSDVENEAKQALVSLNGKPGEQPGRSYIANDGSGTRSSSKCANPICTRESYGRELCDSCQSMFSPLVVSVGDSLSGGSSYPFSGSSAQPEPESSPHGWGDAVSQAKPSSMKTKTACRVKQCGDSIFQGGLCETHFRLFENGSLSVDEITLRSRQSKTQAELAAAPATAAAAAGGAGAKQPSPSNSKLKKYFCKTEGCDKQAQRRGLCKRHFRLQEMSSQKASDSPMAFVSQNQPASANALPCRFSGCLQIVTGGGNALCPLHANASFCWQPGCENIVNGPQFCEFHSYRKQCAYEGCNYSANGSSSGCSNHAMERRCSHEHCDKFAVGTGDRCRLHQISCSEEPCALCEMHGLDSENGYSNRPGSQLQQRGAASHRKANSENFQGGGNGEFVEAKENSSALFRESRLI